jgi:hypothetical protein
MVVGGLPRWLGARDERARIGSRFLSGLLLALVGAAAAGGEPAPKGSVVRVERSGKGFRLLKDDRPYFIRGAGWGNGDLRALKEAGGNSVRTWSADDLGPLLDRAHALGLTVAAGVWLGQAREGFRYDDPKALAAQRAAVRATVLRHRDHPALLLWGLGNEMELGVPDDPRIWQEVNHLARLVKRLDPNHPTMTAVAGINPQKVERLKTLCPDLDILGVNSYGDLPKHLRLLRAAGWTRPYIMAEFGPPGWWEVQKTPWGAPLEATSAAKAEAYLAAYMRAVALHPDRCLGSYAFIWGHKREGTATWFGMLLPGGERLGAVEAMTFAWTGTWPGNRAPRVLFIDSDAEGREVPPGALIDAAAAAHDPDKDPLEFRWEVVAEGGEQAPRSHPEAVVSARGNRLRFRTPKAEGPYRLYVTVLDGRGHAGTANVPFFVKAGAAGRPPSNPAAR